MISEIAAEAKTRLAAPREDDASWFEVAGHKLIGCDWRSGPIDLLAALRTLVEFHYARSEYMIAMRLAERGLAIADEGDLKPQIRHYNHILAVLLRVVGDNGRAISHLATAIELSKQLSDTLAECRAWAQLAGTVLSNGQFTDSIAYARRALAIAGPIGNQARDAKQQCNHIIAEASLHLMHSDPDERQRRLAEGLVTVKNALREAGEVEGSFSAIQLNKLYHTQTQLLLRAGLVREAEESAAVCESLALRSGSGEAMLRAQIGAALIDGAKDRNQDARRYLTDLRAKHFDRKEDQADIVAALAFVCELGGDKESAERTRADLYKSWQRRNIATIYNILDQVNSRNPVDENQLLNAATLEAVETLAVVGEIHDDETGNHVFRVGAMARLIGMKLGHSEIEARHLDFAARLHDLGKIAIHADIMLKPAQLTSAERAEMMKHTTIGAEMLGRITHPVMFMASQIAAGHHERWDGKGYPAGINGDAIPLSARITAVADVFDALTHARCYKDAWPASEAISEISRGRGNAFDPDVVDAFISVIVTLLNEHGQAGLDEVLSASSKDNALVIAREFLSAQMTRHVA